MVYVLNQNDKPLMPCSPGKAKRLLKTGKAVVTTRTPFVIKLLNGSSGYVQPVTLGVDSGFIHIGLSAVTERKEVYSADVVLRSDIVELNSERRMYRRNRRGRKTWYRQPRFDNRKKPEGWLAPSIQHKLDSHKKLICRVQQILPITRVIIEVAAFDIQKIKNPEIEGIDYQNGDQAGFWNTREYVLYRDGHRCQAPKCSHKDKILNVHHIEGRNTGGDRPGNLITLCETCHDKHHRGMLVLKIKRTNGFRAETFMSMVRWRLINQTGAEHTFGYMTKSGRIALKLEKSHVNDAFVIAGGTDQGRAGQLLIRQVRKCNRKLFKGARSHMVNTAPRLVHGFQRFDKVFFHGQECFIFGRRSTGRFDLRGISGNHIHANAPVLQLRLLERARTHQTSRFLPD
jgi:N6-L-threonylcarbamoyladenine synthase